MSFFHGFVQQKPGDFTGFARRNGDFGLFGMIAVGHGAFGYLRPSLDQGSLIAECGLHNFMTIWDNCINCIAKMCHK